MPKSPYFIEPGAKVGLIAPASSTFRPESLAEVSRYLQQKGLEVVEGKAYRKRNGFLAGTDKERANDIMQMFRNRSIKAIFTLRGSYGSGRILDLLDYRMIAKNPKPLIGFSDLTFLCAAIYQKSKIITFHGPTLYSLLQDDPTEYSWNKLWQVLSGKADIDICDDYVEKETIEVIKGGKSVIAPLVGGNLSILSTLVGTPWEFSYAGKIVFFEDLNEPPYRIDRMLTHMINAKCFEKVKGFAIGLCKDCIDPLASQTLEKRQTFNDVIKERLSKFKVPIVTGLPFGHASFNATLPIGKVAKLDPSKKKLIILIS